MRILFNLVMSLLLMITSFEARAGATIKPGQYTIDHIQDICLKNDGTWYGTTFKFGGTWTRDQGIQTLAEIWGNYSVHGASGVAKANSTITVKKDGSIFANWHDWFDDLSYGTFLFNSFVFVKANCDPPFRGENTHAASE